MYDNLFIWYCLFFLLLRGGCDTDEFYKKSKNPDVELFDITSNDLKMGSNGV